MIEIRGVEKRYGAFVALDCPTLDIDGGVTGLIGPNGAGKSTLLSVVARLVPRDAGTVAIGGLDIDATPSAELARVVSVLRQDNIVAIRLTVRELVEFGRFPYSGGKLTTSDDAAVDDAIAALELTDLAEQRLDRLSGGQRQRAFIAAVLAQQTEHVLLDEPLNSLDMHQASRTMTEVRRLADEFGKTVLIVLHDVNTAAHHADRLVGLRDGRVLVDGTPSEVISTSGLRALYDAAPRVIDVDGRPVALHFTRRS